MARKIVIVGGVAGGATAAARLRRLDETAEIIMFEKDEYISFANCGLPYHIGGTIEERGALIVQSPEAMRRRFRIDVRTNSRVTAVDTKNKRVSAQGPDGVYEESYDVLVLSPGAEPVIPSIVNTAPDRVFTLRSIRDTDRINDYITEAGVKSAAVIGGGFVGVEMAENLTERGVAVKLVEALDHILAPFDGEMANIAQREMRAHGVELLLGDGISAIEKAADKAKVTLASGLSFETDMVVMAIGVRPATAFLKESGVALGPKGHIVTDEHMCTSIPDVYAAGDAVQIKDFVTGQPTAVPLAGPANRQARVAADNIAGIPHTYGGAQGTAVIKVFGLTAAATGANERTLKRLNMQYHAITRTHSRTPRTTRARSRLP
jgi:NADPH-dependent 2,4-dienoyl-CoA reductase/sulfur reductase-like enzyme